MSDKTDLYSDRGVLLKSDADLSAHSLLKGNTMHRLIAMTKRITTVFPVGAEPDQIHSTSSGYGVVARPSKPHGGFRTRHSKPSPAEIKAQRLVWKKENRTGKWH